MPRPTIRQIALMGRDFAATPATPVVALARLSSTSFRATISGAGAADLVTLRWRLGDDLAWTSVSLGLLRTADVTGVDANATVVAVATSSDGSEVSAPSELAILSLYLAGGSSVGWSNPAMLALRDLVADCPTFQSWVSALNGAAALASIFAVSEEAAAVSFPCAMIYGSDGPFRATVDSGGERNFFVHAAGLTLEFVEEIPVDPTTGVPTETHRAAELRFMATVGVILGEIEERAGASGRLDIDGYSKKEGPGRTDPDDKVGGRTLQCVSYEVGWRG